MKEPKRILAVIEPQSEEQPALDRAIELSMAMGASLRLSLCEYVAGLSTGVLVSDEQAEKARDEYRSNQKGYLDGLAARATDAGVDEVDTKLRWQRPIHEAIIEAAEEFGADLIVKSAADRSIVDRVLISATDWELIRKVPQLLWLVKRQQEAADATWIAAVDPSHPDEKHVGLDRRVIEAGLEIGRNLGAKLRLFHAVTPPTVATPTDSIGAAVPAFSALPAAEDEFVETRREVVEKLAEGFEISGERVDIHLGATVRGLNSLVDEHDAALVIAGAVSRGIFERVLIGNTAESMLNSIDCDILVVKPEGFAKNEDKNDE